VFADSNANVSTPDAHRYSHSYRITQPYADGYSDHYAYCYCYCDFHSHLHPNDDSTSNPDIYAYGYSDEYAQDNAYAQAACNAEGTTHPAAAAITEQLLGITL